MHHKNKLQLKIKALFSFVLVFVSLSLQMPVHSDLRCDNCINPSLLYCVYMCTEKNHGLSIITEHNVTVDMAE